MDHSSIFTTKEATISINACFVAMYVCVCVYMYVHVCMYVGVYIQCTYVCMYVYVRMCL